MLEYVLAVLGGFIILIWGADRFVMGAAAIAANLGISPLIIGLTIVGFGTSAPEILISAMASADGNTGLAIGNAIGSNIANIALILGITALVMPLVVNSNILRREYPILFAVSLLAMLLMMDNNLGRMDGIILLITLIAVMTLLVRIAMSGREQEVHVHDRIEDEFDAEIPRGVPMPKAVFLFVLGLVLLLVSSRMLVWGAVHIAQHFGVSDLVIGLTVVAIGTSLPELAASIMSAIKNEHDIAIGNIIGSNMFNLMAVLSMPGLIAPATVPAEVLGRDYPVMLALTGLLFLFAYGFRGQGRINRLEGGALLSIFAGYQYYLFISISALKPGAVT